MAARGSWNGRLARENIFSELRVPSPMAVMLDAIQGLGDPIRSDPPHTGVWGSLRILRNVLEHSGKDHEGRR